MDGVAGGQRRRAPRAGGRAASSLALWHMGCAVGSAGFAVTLVTHDVPDPSPAATWMIHDLWYKNAVVYSLDVETFLDASGDGCGDFEGLSRRLDYLEALGIDAVWLAPFQPSPRRDDGYDIADYYGFDPRFGSGGDFVEFMREAESRGIRVLIDLVVNHTSDRHPWFRERPDWYVWSKKRPSNWKSGVVFPGVQQSTWSFDKRTRQY